MRGKKALKRVLICGMVVCTLPLFFVSLQNKLPKADYVVLSAAENAAEIALITLYDNSESDTVTATEAIQAAQAIAEAQTEKREKILKITVDDSAMLSKSDRRFMPSSEDEEGFVDEPTPGETAPDLGDLDGTVSEVTFSAMNGANYINLEGGGQIRNLTDNANSQIEEIIESAKPLVFKADGTPEILIYHTHATESYLPEGQGGAFDTDFPFRSSDTSINIVSVGNAIKKELEAAGIGVIHDETLYDEESYNGSYEKSRAGVKKILDENPNIKLVLDVHRDAIVRTDTEIVSAIADINGKNAAQIMIISNCNGDTLKYPIPNYRENLGAAVALQNKLCEDYPGLCRPILFDYRQYNQDLSPGSLLIEIGSHGNTQSEAVYSGELIGKTLAEFTER
jgi:stage II sporulation protein P